MARVIYAVVAALTVHIIGAMKLPCPSDPHCRCTGSFAIELNCNIDGSMVQIDFLPNTYINIKCENATSLDYSKLPRCTNDNNATALTSISFKDCPLPTSSFKDIMSNIGVTKTMALIFQNAKTLSGYFDRKHFAGLQDLTKLLLSINGITHLPDNLFVDINKLTWLNIRSNTINLSEELLKPLERLETLEISHNHMTNISSNLFSHLSFLRKLSLWQSNVTWFSKDLFTGVNVLEELDLSSNELNELPMSIFKPLRKLKKLTLFSNKFSTLPKNLFSNNTELETVIILNNDVKLKELPKALFQSLPHLKQIHIQRSGLEIVPYDVFFNSSLIKNISLAYNDIEELPEPVFNDQINLLELDLSYNKLYTLMPQLFSSLLRLERLNLCHNSIKEIFGITFSSLLSLTYLNMEHNHLKTIHSYMFINNRQRMSISFAYNELSFAELVTINETEYVSKRSPFIETYNLKLLNLSHNNFFVHHGDWWRNGHENLDISYNSIKLLWEDVPGSCLKEAFKIPLNVWVSHNPLICFCGKDSTFCDLFRESKSQVMDDSLIIDCATITYGQIFRILLNFTLVFCSALMYIALMVVYVKSSKALKASAIKSLARLRSGKDTFGVVVKFSIADVEFVFEEILPKLYYYKTMKVYLDMIKDPDTNDNIMSETPRFCDYHIQNNINLVLFTPNYVTSAFSHLDIKKIHSEMWQARHTVYVFANIGPENSIYDYLKSQRDPFESFLWKEKLFWQSVLMSLEGKWLTVKSENKNLKNSSQFCNCKAISSTMVSSTISTTNKNPPSYEDTMMSYCPV